jgi:nickel/cobalt transporter (NicO) family protein
MVSLFWALALAGASVGALHSLAPDHWVPFAAVARAQRWSRARTARVTLACGIGHVTVSVALGVAGLALGTAVLQALGRRLEAVASVLLVGFGLAYAAWGLRGVIGKRLPGHSHGPARDPSRITAWTLFLLFCADPCVAVVPIVFAAAPLGAVSAAEVVIIYELATIGTMLALVLVAHAGVTGLRSRWLDRYGDGAAGGLIAATGLVLLLVGG